MDAIHYWVLVCGHARIWGANMLLLNTAEEETIMEKILVNITDQKFQNNIQIGIMRYVYNDGSEEMVCKECRKPFNYERQMKSDLIDGKSHQFYRCIHCGGRIELIYDTDFIY